MNKWHNFHFWASYSFKRDRLQETSKMMEKGWIRRERRRCLFRRHVYCANGFQSFIFHSSCPLNKMLRLEEKKKNLLPFLILYLYPTCLHSNSENYLTSPGFCIQAAGSFRCNSPGDFNAKQQMYMSACFSLYLLKTQSLSQSQGDDLPIKSQVLFFLYHQSLINTGQQKTWLKLETTILI